MKSKHVLLLGRPAVGGLQARVGGGAVAAELGQFPGERLVARDQDEAGVEALLQKSQQADHVALARVLVRLAGDRPRQLPAVDGE